MCKFFDAEQKEIEQKEIQKKKKKDFDQIFYDFYDSHSMILLLKELLYKSVFLKLS